MYKVWLVKTSGIWPTCRCKCFGEVFCLHRHAAKSNISYTICSQRRKILWNFHHSIQNCTASYSGKHVSSTPSHDNLEYHVGCDVTHWNVWTVLENATETFSCTASILTNQSVSSGVIRIPSAWRDSSGWFQLLAWPCEQHTGSQLVNLAK
jgi:hypothetical protein